LDVHTILRNSALAIFRKIERRKRAEAENK
jgi:hypothetical protein